MTLRWCSTCPACLFFEAFESDTVECAKYGSRKRKGRREAIRQSETASARVDRYARAGRRKRSSLSIVVYDRQHRFSIGVEHTEGGRLSPISPLPSPPTGIIGITSVRGRMTLGWTELAPGQPAAKRRLDISEGRGAARLVADHGKECLGLSQGNFAPYLAKASVLRSNPRSKPPGLLRLIQERRPHRADSGHRPAE